MVIKEYILEHLRYLFKPNSLVGLDILRATAVLLVVVAHYSYYSSSETFGDLAAFGFIGVDLFFVLSGFLVGRIVISSITAQSSLWPVFYKRRALRILPLYFVATLLTVGILWYRSEFRIDAGFILYQLLLDFTFMHTAWQAPMELSAWGSWSLAIEEWFYVLMPLAMLGLFRAASKFPFATRRRFLLAGILILILGGLCARFLTIDYISQQGASVWIAGKKPWARFDELFIGVLIGFLKFHGSIRWGSVGRIASLVLGFSVIVLCFFLHSSWKTNVWMLWGPFLLASGFGLMTIYFYDVSASHWVIHVTSKLSYSIYLTHLFIRMLVPQGYVVDLIWIVPLTFILSYLASLLVEYPFIRLYRGASERTQVEKKWIPSGGIGSPTFFMKGFGSKNK